MGIDSTTVLLDYILVDCPVTWSLSWSLPQRLSALAQRSPFLVTR